VNINTCRSVERSAQTKQGCGEIRNLLRLTNSFGLYSESKVNEDHFRELLMLLSTAGAAVASKKQSSAQQQPAPSAPRQDGATTKTKQTRNNAETHTN
jgi:hypothetical protein